MTRCHGNEKVAAGLYFRTAELAFKTLDAEGVLPGTALDAYVRVPAIAMLIVGPLLGAAYVMFLPCIGFVMLFWALGETAVGFVVEAAESVARVMKPTWHPALAFFSKARAAARRHEGKDPWADEIKRKLEEDEEGPHA